MKSPRFLRHFSARRLWTRRQFTPAVLQAIEREIAAGETRHGGEIRFAVEPALPRGALRQGAEPRERALEVFSQLRVWDTELNNGVLIYVLLAERDVEIVADRGFNGRVGAGEWEAVCRAMEVEFRNARFEAGAIAGIRGVSALIAQHFPPQANSANELPDHPAFL